MKKYEETNQVILRVEKELQRLKSLKAATKAKLQGLLNDEKRKTLIDLTTESKLKEKISGLRVEVSKLRRAPEAIWKSLKNSFNNFNL